MPTPTKRTTVYLDPVAVSKSVSELINKAVRESLKKDRHRYKLIEELTSAPQIKVSKPKK